MVPIEMSTSHFYSTSMHTIGLSCIVWAQHTTRQTDDRQCDRNRRPMRYNRWPKLHVSLADMAASFARPEKTSRANPAMNDQFRAVAIVE